MKKHTPSPESGKRASKTAPPYLTSSSDKPSSRNAVAGAWKLQKPKEKFASQGDPKTLFKIRKIAEAEGRQFQSVLDEAMRDFILKKEGQKPRPQVMEALAASLKDFDDLYRNLAK